MLNEQEKKQIRKFCLLPAVAKGFLAGALLIGFVWAFLVMVNDMVFHGDFYMTGMCVFLGIAAVYTAAYIVCFFIPRKGMKKEIWKGILEKADVKLSEKDYSAEAASVLGAKAAGQLLGRSEHASVNRAGDVLDAAAAIGSLAVVTQMTDEAGKNAKAVAAVFGEAIPKAKKYVIPILLLPMLLLTAVYIPQYMSSRQSTNAEIAVASEAVYALRSSLQQDCDHVIIGDPKEEYRSSGYQVAGYLYAFEEPHNSYVSVTVGNDGIISQVQYCIDMDLQADKEKNLERAKSDLFRLNRMLNDAGVKAMSDVLLEEYTLPETFISRFREGSYYEDLRVQKDEHVTVQYMTESEEEYDKYSESYIYFSIDV